MLQQYLAVGYRLIIAQLILLSVVAGFFIAADDRLGFISVLLGGSAWIIPSLYFVHKLFKARTNWNAQALLKAFLMGEGIKFLLSIGLIISIVLFVTIKTWAFLCGYIAVIAASLLMPFWYIGIKVKHDNRRPTSNH
jgi:ATP synthase protein I